MVMRHQIAVLLYLDAGRFLFGYGASLVASKYIIAERKVQENCLIVEKNNLNLPFVILFRLTPN